MFRSGIPPIPLCRHHFPVAAGRLENIGVIKHGLERGRVRQGVAPPAARSGIAPRKIFGQYPALWFDLDKKMCFSPVQQDQCCDLSWNIGGDQVRDILLTPNSNTEGSADPP